MMCRRHDDVKFDNLKSINLWDLCTALVVLGGKHILQKSSRVRSTTSLGMLLLTGGIRVELSSALSLIGGGGVSCP